MVDVYTSEGINGEPAVLADNYTVSGGQPSGAPEPSVWALMIAGVAMVGSALRFGRRRSAMIEA